MATPSATSASQDGNDDRLSFIAILRVRQDFFISKDFLRPEIPGLNLCETIYSEAGDKLLYTLWQSAEHYRQGKLFLCSYLERGFGDSVFEWEGSQGEVWKRSERKTLSQRVLSWSFAVNAVAVLGVLHALATYYESFTAWSIAWPRSSIVDTSKPREIVASQASIQKLALRNETPAGKSRFTLDAVEIEASPAPEHRETNKPPQCLPILQSSVFGAITPDAVAEFSVEVPALAPGEYRLFVRGSQASGFLWKMCGFGKFRHEAGKIVVFPRLELRSSRTLEAVARDDGRVSKLLTFEVFSALDSPGVRGRIWLEESDATIQSLIGVPAKKMEFPPEAEGYSGFTWRTGGMKAKSSVNLSVIIDGLKTTNWEHIAQKIRVSELEHAEPGE